MARDVHIVALSAALGAVVALAIGCLATSVWLRSRVVATYKLADGRLVSHGISSDRCDYLMAATKAADARVDITAPWGEVYRVVEIRCDRGR